MPADLLARGWRLIVRAPGRMFAVSDAWGCTGTKTDIRVVIMEAYELTEFIAWVKAQAE